jgi:hypothetical protein
MLPEDLRQVTVPLGLDAFLEQILYDDMSIRQGFGSEDATGERDPELPPWGPQLSLYFRGRLNDKLGLALPSIGGVELVLGAGKIGFDADVDFETERFSITLSADVLTIRFARSLLQPVVRKQISDPNDPTGEKTITIFEADPDQNKKIELAFQVAVTVNESGSIEVTWPDNSPQSLTLPPAMIGDTRVVVEGNLGIDFSTTTVLPDVTGRALEPEWVGVVVREFQIYLPPDMAGIVPQQIAGNCLIGSNGLSAELHGNWLDAAGNPTAVFKEVKQQDGSMKRFYEGAGSFSFFGMPGGMRTLELDIEDNIPVRSEVEAEFLLPFFDAPVAVNLGVGLDGSIDLELRPAADESEALVKVRREDLLELTISSLGVERRGDQVKFGLSGEIKPLIPGVDWPSFRVDELSIDTRGHVHLDGGWLNLRETYEVNFKGFKLEISKLGFGKNEDGSKWIGFTGGVKLVEGMPAGASVEGLRITWYEDGSKDPAISLNGVRVNFEVPNTLKFAGAVSYDKDKQQFYGAVKLDLMALNMQVDATAVFGMKDGNQAQPYLALYLAAEFPAGIPLFATGLGVYGAAGLFAMNMEPNRAPNQAWYSLPEDGDWYHQGDDGVTALDKWKPVPGSMAFGAGVTLGTIADNGHTFSGNMLLAIVFPGPILLLQGSANILRERATFADDADFRALAVLDGRAGTLQLGLDAKYRYDDNGNLIDISGSADGFFNFNDPSAWHLNVGLDEPRDRRLTARLFKLFDSYSYVMLNSQQLAMGTWVGFQQNWTFGPLNVGLEAWIDGNARVSWKPAHFYGDLALHGSARLSVFGFGAGITVDASIKADVFDPLHIQGDFSVAIDLPWPLPDFSAGVNLEWGPQPTKPPFPLALKEVAIEHFKASTSWPLPRTERGDAKRLLFPNFDSNDDGFWENPTGSDALTIPSNLDDLPIVPLDSRPHLTFARNVNDDALVGMNAMPVNPEFERIGDPALGKGPASLRYGLKEVVLEKLNSSGQWKAVARKGMTANDPGVPTLFGSWAPVPQMPGGGGRNVGQTKLWLWSKTPFEYTRRTSRSWDEWFTDEYSDYPCQMVIPEGWDFENIAADPNVPDPFRHPEEPGLAITQNILNVIRFNGFSIQQLEHPSHGLNHAFGISGQHIEGTTLFALPRKSSFVRILIPDGRLIRANDFQAFDDLGNSTRGKAGGTPDAPYVDITGKDLTQIFYRADVYQRLTLASNLRDVRGCAYDSQRQRIIFVEFKTGNLSSVDVNSGQYNVLGSGYSSPMDVALTADGNTAYITEDTGTLLRVDLANDKGDHSLATLITKDIVGPRQIALDEANDKAYVVEAKGEGRLLSIELAGPKTGTQTPIVKGLVNAFGLLLTKDGTTAYVCEIGDGPVHGRLTRINVVTRESKILFEELDIIFFLRWESDAQNSILVMQWDPDGNSLARLDVTGNSRAPEELETGFPLPFWGVLVLPNDRFVVCSDTVFTMFATTLLIPKIIDIGGSVFSRHFQEEFDRWKQAGEVLEPHTKYRLQVTTTMRMLGDVSGPFADLDEVKTATEFAYFRTTGPPGAARLTPPAGSEAVASTSDEYVSSLNDLSRYVRKTMPATVEPTPANPVPSQLAYRAYDIGLDFDENYVDLMYRIGRRDLSIHVHDGNGAIRDDQGRRLILSNQWSEAETVTLRDHEERWLSVLGDGGCNLIPIDSVVRDTTFNATTVAHLLPSSSLCEARLVPALLHDAFDGYTGGANGPQGKFGRWQVQDLAGPELSQWKINSPGSDTELVQMKNATSLLAWTNAPASELPATHAEQPLNWTDYRMTVYLQFNDTGRAGVVWRYRDAGQHYRFVMERGATSKCEIFRVTGGAPVSLANTTEFTPPSGPDTFPIIVEVVGSTFNVYHESENGNTRLTTLILSATDSTIATGSVGFYTSGSSSARFTDIYVDDFRATAPVVYRFSFLSSRFKNFNDQMASFENKTTVAEIAPTANAAPFVNAAGSVGEAPTDAESRGYDGFAALVPGVVATPVVRVTRIEQLGSAIAFLVQSPEPLDWKRINVNLKLQSLKLTDTDIPIKVLRKADGAGIMIVAPNSTTPSGSFFPQGNYRLVFTYRRDNRAKDPNSDVLSEAGITTPEVVTLDLPWILTPQKNTAEEIAEVLVPA